ncbi:hypothetical protein [Aestuariivirga sp.]|uniref:hypothetical protein n=1 Tax=Aestuariivirga sp. TaxID=2650926 RepID=UPI0039E424B9
MPPPAPKKGAVEILRGTDEALGLGVVAARRDRAHHGAIGREDVHLRARGVAGVHVHES